MLTATTADADTQAFRLLPEHPDNLYRLGRHQMLDTLVAEFAAIVDELEPILDVDHTEVQDPFDQGKVGDCTMNAGYGCLVTAPLGKAGQTPVTQAVILSGYELETRLDDSQIPGHYPPNDTGSTGAWSMTTLVKLGLISGWHHTRSLRTALIMLNKGAISIGVRWYQSMFTPDADGTIHVVESSGVAGGHQLCVVANDTKNRRIRLRNSWGTGWGDNGHCWLSWADFALLLKQGGDVVQPLALAA
ncbi:C1 family peptidase [Streptacidiphilus sp. N1-12]|uniref:C1 family peptidase n=2 Tax=Streptacidiphilus alkalitolerans TaxID=3342712 RepID=A0ABV6VA76_9ACTN